MSYTVGSLFAGIGGIDLGFERAGFKTVWQVEQNVYCNKVLAKNFPDADRSVTDVREAGKHNLKPVDVIVGGFPCQDISNAGKRAGIDGERSGLWSEYARIICELRPKYVLVENVAALLGRGMGRVLGDLAEIRYDAEWEIISAADVGAPHLRERVWIIAYRQSDPPCPNADGIGSYRTEIHEHGSSELRNQQIGEFGQVGEALADTPIERLQNRSTIAVGKPPTNPKPKRSGWWAVEPNVGRVANGVSRRVDRLRGLGNAVVPEIPYQIALRIKKALESV